MSAPGERLCVAIFRRPDGSAGFGGYRREPEDGRRWFAPGAHEALRFATAAKAEAAVRAAIPWMTDP